MHRQRFDDALDTGWSKVAHEVLSAKHVLTRATSPSQHKREMPRYRHVRTQGLAARHILRPGSLPGS